MWENKQFFNNIKRVYDVFEIEGYNQDRLINLIKSRDITIFGIKKIHNKLMTVKVKISQSEKLFAITNNLCYNIKYVKRTGLFYPIHYLLNNFGIVLGCISFVIIATVFSNIIVGFEFIGSGSILSEQLTNYLNSKGVEKYSYYSSIDIDKLKNEMLSENEALTFVEIYKDGNRLVIDSHLKTGENIKEKKIYNSLYSDESGVVKEIKVYKGTAQINVGDNVKKGQLLIDGYTVIRENKIPTTVNGKVLIEVSKKVEFEVESELDDESALLIVLSSDNITERQINNKKVEKAKKANNYIYTVYYSYNHLIQTE